VRALISTTHAAAGAIAFELNQLDGPDATVQLLVAEALAKTKQSALPGLRYRA
jgi:hypothetical protein